MNRGSAFFLVFLIFFLQSCRRDDFGEVRPDDPVPIFTENGLWVINEGLFGFANGEISFINLNNNTISNGVFSSVNGIPPGDIPMDLLVDQEHILLTVNNSDRLYALTKETFSVKFQIFNIPSPRYIQKITTKEYAVSSFANDSIYFVSLNGVVPHVSALYLGKSTESLILFENRLYAANWSAYGGNFDNSTIQVIDPFAKTLLTTFQVGKEPNSMQVDKNGHLWVLCSGGFMNEELPKLFEIDLLTYDVIRWFEFPLIDQSPSALSINQQRDKLYFINDHVYAMNVSDTALPSQPLIYKGNRNFYNMNASVLSDKIVLTDAKNYQTQGSVLLYKSTGEFVAEFQAGIIPSVVRKNVPQQ